MLHAVFVHFLACGKYIWSSVFTVSDRGVINPERVTTITLRNLC